MYCSRQWFNAFASICTVLDTTIPSPANSIPSTPIIFLSFTAATLCYSDSTVLFSYLTLNYFFLCYSCRAPGLLCRSGHIYLLLFTLFTRRYTLCKNKSQNNMVQFSSLKVQSSFSAHRINWTFPDLLLCLLRYDNTKHINFIFSMSERVSCSHTAEVHHCVHLEFCEPFFLRL